MFRARTIAVVAAAGLLAGCSSTGSPAPSAIGSSGPASSGASLAPVSGAITVYNAQHESLTQEWATAFTKQTGVMVTLRQGSDTEIGNLLIAEGAASPADVFLTENSPAIALVAGAGMLASVDAATLAQVPAAYRPSTGTWTGIAARSTLFAYNPTLLTTAQLPASLLDLQKPEWKGRWAASPSGADFQAIVSALVELKGQDAAAAWLAGMKTNVTAFQGNSTVMKAVNTGQIPGGVIYHYYWYADQAKTGENSQNVKLHYFKRQDPGAFVSVSGGGVLKTSKNAAAAQAFLRFITGVDGQTVLKAGTSYEYAIASNVAAHPKLVPLADLDAPTIDPAKLDSRKTTDLMTRAGIL